MGFPKTSKVHALVSNQRNKNNKQKQQFKGKKEHNPRDAQENSDFKDGKTKKENKLCAYYRNDPHREQDCRYKRYNEESS